MREERTQVLTNVTHNVSYIFTIFLKVLVKVNTLPNTRMGSFARCEYRDWVQSEPLSRSEVALRSSLTNKGNIQWIARAKLKRHSVDLNRAWD